jgi:pyruvate dehydrogenase E1 component alpha subunit
MTTELARLQHAGVDQMTLIDWLSRMMMIRDFEETGERLTARGKIPGGMHPAIGQEAVAVGVAAALKEGDVVAATHRSHHHALAWGLSPNAVMAELYGKATGVVGGRSGSMHLADVAAGFYGANGIVGAGVGLALGAALAAKLRGEPNIAVGFVGDGGLNTGRTWESINLASAWQLPLVVVCENNLYAVETPISSVMGGGSAQNRAEGFGVASLSVDGQDVAGMYAATAEARQRAISGGGPTFIEARTYRYHGHTANERATYRTDDEVTDWRRSKDPIDRLTAALVSEGLVTEENVGQMLVEARFTVQAAVDFAEASEWPAG